MLDSAPDEVGSILGQSGASSRREVELANSVGLDLKRRSARDQPRRLCHGPSWHRITMRGRIRFGSSFLLDCSSYGISFTRRRRTRKIPVGTEVSGFGTAAAMAETADSRRQRQSSDRGAAGRIEARDGLRQREVPQPDGVLQPANGDLHDPGQRLHATLRVLRGASRPATPIARSRRTRASRRSGRPTGAEACGDHQRDPRRSCPTVARIISTGAWWRFASGPERRPKC